MRLKRILFIFCGSTIVVLIYFVLAGFVFPKLKHSADNTAWSLKHAQPAPRSRRVIYIVVVACGQRLQETLTMIKSALLYNHCKDLLKFVIFAEDNLSGEFHEKLTDWHNLLPREFEYDLKALSFPKNSEKEWKSLFKPCAAQRLFLPSLLSDIDAVLYVDTDILFLSPVADIWDHFRHFNLSHIAGLSPEHENANIGWYNRFARHPFYGKLGLNSGVMLMNLTQMRRFNWEARVLPIYKEYKLRITWGDQDIINILFYYHSEKLYLFSCEYNYRPDHCMYANVCNVSNGIKIIHGNRGYFHSSKEPLFKAVYDAIQSYQLANNVYSSFLAPLKEALEDQIILDSNCGTVSKNILQVAQKIFLNEYNYDDA